MTHENYSRTPEIPGETKRLLALTDVIEAALQSHEEELFEDFSRLKELLSLHNLDVSLAQLGQLRGLLEQFRGDDALTEHLSHAEALLVARVNDENTYWHDTAKYLVTKYRQALYVNNSEDESASSPILDIDVVHEPYRRVIVMCETGENMDTATDGVYVNISKLDLNARRAVDAYCAAMEISYTQ